MLAAVMTVTMLVLPASAAGATKASAIESNLSYTFRNNNTESAARTLKIVLCISVQRSAAAGQGRAALVPSAKTARTRRCIYTENQPRCSVLADFCARCLKCERYLLKNSTYKFKKNLVIFGNIMYNNSCTVCEVRTHPAVKPKVAAVCREFRRRSGIANPAKNGFSKNRGRARQ